MTEKKVFAYYVKTESGDDKLVITEKDYQTAVRFMKDELPAEYESWKQEGLEDEEIPYDTYIREEYTINV